jgi:hypothetical protein
MRMLFVQLRIAAFTAFGAFASSLSTVTSPIIVVHDLWLSLLSTFRLFEADGPGEKLGVAPLAGDLFGYQAIQHLAGCTLGNDVLLGCIRALNVYENPVNHQLIRVNYAALNVEEFGSVYEGLLEYEPAFHPHGKDIEFVFETGR